MPGKQLFCRATTLSQSDGRGLADDQVLLEFLQVDFGSHRKKLEIRKSKSETNSKLKEENWLSAKVAEISVPGGPWISPTRKRGVSSDSPRLRVGLTSDS